MPILENKVLIALSEKGNELISLPATLSHQTFQLPSGTDAVTEKSSDVTDRDGDRKECDVP